MVLKKRWNGRKDEEEENVSSYRMALRKQEGARS
jgi:hypothetical protein